MTARAARNVSLVLVIAALALLVATAASVLSGGRPTPAAAAPPVVAAVAAPAPLAIALEADSIVVANLTVAPLERCLVRTAGDLIGEIPFVAAHASERRSFVSIFGSEDAERAAHLAGYTFDAYVQAMAAIRVTVACRDAVDGTIVRGRLP